MTKTRAACLAAIGAAFAALAWAQTLRPGEYEVTVAVQLPGLPQPQTTTTKACLSADEARDFRGYFTKMLSETEVGCTFSTPKTTGNKLSWDTKCDSATASSEITFVTDGYTAVVRTIVAGTVVTANARGKWVGATCTAE